MTASEAAERYSIPRDLMDEYMSWGLCGGADLDDTDLERLGIMITLRDVGFSEPEIETYMRLSLVPGSEAERLRLLDKRRAECLDDIHAREKRLGCIDYLRHSLRGSMRS